MAIAVEVKNYYDLSGHYARVTGEDGDTVYLEFGKGVVDRRSYPLFYHGAAWQCTPESGATVTVQYAFRPDYDKLVDAHWVDHEDKGSFTSVENDREEAPLGALRFTAASAGMTIEVWSPAEVVIS